MDKKSRRRAALRVSGTAAMGVLTLVLGSCASPTGEDGDDSRPSVVRPVAPVGVLPDALQADLSSIVEQTMDEYNVPGAAVGVWIPGAGSWTTAAGVADVDTREPVTVDMAWPMRSVTKSYTVTLVLQLVDEGVISLDDTIDMYVDEVTDGDRITLRELADMSSGNADYVNDDFVEAFTEDPKRIFTLDELNGFMLGEPAQFEPGERHVYTNANTNLLGAVIEKATGQEYADVLQERILTPLGQESTRYVLDEATWTEPHARGYVFEDGAQSVQDNNLSIFGAAGSMVGGLDDARVWAEVLATGALLDPATQAKRLKGARLEEGPPYDLYALGIGRSDGWWGHNGEGLGFTAAVFHHVESGASIAVFMNASNVVSGAHPADQAFRRMAEAVAEALVA